MKTVRTMLLLVVIGVAIQCNEPAPRKVNVNTEPAAIKIQSNETVDQSEQEAVNTEPTAIKTKTFDSSGAKTWTIEVTDDPQITADPVSQGVDVADVLTITVQPVGGSKYVGDAHTCSCTATGANGTLTYQWQQDGMDIVGATTDTYNIASLALGDMGDYQCLVGDDVHPPLPLVCTAVATLFVADVLTITVHPVGTNKMEGDSYTFPITATYPPLRYSWYRGAVARPATREETAAAWAAATHLDILLGARYDWHSREVKPP